MDYALAPRLLPCAGFWFFLLASSPAAGPHRMRHSCSPGKRASASLPGACVTFRGSAGVGWSGEHSADPGTTSSEGHHSLPAPSSRNRTCCAPGGQAATLTPTTTESQEENRQLLHNGALLASPPSQLLLTACPW